MNEQRIEFKNLLLSTKRIGIDKLIEYLEIATDFFITPSSSNYHGSYKSGLLEHSLEVYKHLKNLCKVYECDVAEDNLIIIALLHDICKINFYQPDIRNVKKDGIWYQVDYFSINDSLPLGHGEKSVIILQQFISLSYYEIMAIRWHMLGFDEFTKSYIGNLTLNKATELYPIIFLVHCADLLSISQKIKKEVIENGKI